jgi:hypothetical protein
MDEELRAQLQAELREKRRALSVLEMKLARYGIDAPVGITMDAEDMRKAVAALEAELGIKWPVPAPEPIHRQRYEPPPESAPVFERRVAEQQTRARQQEIAHQIRLLGIHRLQMAHYREQARYFGGLAAAPPMTRHGMQEAREGIAQIKRVLRG